MYLFRCVLLGVLGVLSAAAFAGDPEAGRDKAQVCLACHGGDGNSVLAMYPKIAGQQESYLIAQISAFRDRERVNELMAPMVENLSDEDIRDLAAYYAGQEVQHGAAPKVSVTLGERLYRGGNLETQVPACMSCHGPKGVGNGPAAWPALAGQHAEYVASQLRAYAGGTRGGGPNGMMADIARKLTDEEIEAVAGYVSGLH